LFAPLDLGDLEGDPVDVGEGRAGAPLLAQAEGGAVDLVELGVELLPVLLEAGGDRPVFLGLEGADLVLALGDEAERDGLDAPGREPGADRLPEDRAHLVAYQAVQDT